MGAVALQPETHHQETRTCRKPSAINTELAGTQIPHNLEIKQKQQISTTEAHK